MTWVDWALLVETMAFIALIACIAAKAHCSPSIEDRIVWLLEKDDATGVEIELILDVGSSRMHPVLARLELERKIESRWGVVDPVSKRRPRIYSLRRSA